MPTHRTPKTLAHENASAFPGPAIGEPFNFYALSTGVLVVAAIMRHPALSFGAKFLWGVIRNFSKQKGACHARVSRLANALGVSVRQIPRYRRDLEGAGLLRVIERRGGTNSWLLLWHPVFTSDAFAQGRRKRQGFEPYTSGGPALNGMTYSGSYSGVVMDTIEVSSSSEASMGQSSPKNDDEKPPNPTRSAASKQAWKTAAKRAVEISEARHAEADRNALAAVIETSTGKLPALELINSVLDLLAQSNCSLPLYALELSARSQLLSHAPGPAFCVKLAKDICSGNLAPYRSTLVARAAESEQLIVHCGFCAQQLGKGICHVTIHGELLPVGDFLEVPESDWHPTVKEAPCPVCADFTRSVNPT